MVHTLGIGADDFAAYLANDVKHTVVVVHSILKVLRCIVVLVFVCVVALFELDDALH